MRINFAFTIYIIYIIYAYIDDLFVFEMKPQKKIHQNHCLSLISLSYFSSNVFLKSV